MKGRTIGFLAGAAGLLGYWAYRLNEWQLSPLVWWVWLAGALVLGLLYAAFTVSYRWGAWGTLARQIFGLALLVRIGLVLASPQTDTAIDVQIYMDAGQLMAHGINPYDYSDAAKLRNQWRTDTYAYAYHTAYTQRDWDYYAGSNLPLAQLLFGLEETTAHHVWAYRFGFALLDAVLSAMVFLFVARLWRGVSEDAPSLKTVISSLWRPGQPLFYALMLGTFSPVMLKSGTLISEPKGTCLLLIVASLLAYYTASRWWPAVLMGLSIGFMGLGAFFAPILGWRTLTGSGYVPNRLSSLTTPTYLRQTIGLVAVVVACTLVWFIPYLPEVFTMAANRTARGSDMINHASMWRGLNAVAPDQVQWVRFVFGACFAAVLLVGFVLRRLSIETLCAGVALFFLNIIVTEGSLDRVNVSLLPAILLIGREDTRAARHLSVIYLFTGLLALFAAVILWLLVHAGLLTNKPSFAYVDGTLCFLFMSYYLYWMIRQVRRQPVTVTERAQPSLVR